MADPNPRNNNNYFQIYLKPSHRKEGEFPLRMFFDDPEDLMTCDFFSQVIAAPKFEGLMTRGTTIIGWAEGKEFTLGVTLKPIQIPERFWKR